MTAAPYDHERDGGLGPVPVWEGPPAELFERSRLQRLVAAYGVRSDAAALHLLRELLGEDPVYAWRRSRFIEAGASSSLAGLLAGSHVDTNAFADLVAGGCDVETAWRILR